MNMVDETQLGILADHHVVEPHVSQAGEGWLEPRQRLQGGVRFDEFVFVEDRQAVAVLDRHHGLVEIAAVPGPGGALLGAQGKRVHIFPAPATECGNSVGSQTLGDNAIFQRDRRIVQPGAAVAPHLDPGHALDAAGNHQVLPTGGDFHGRQIHRFQAGGTETIELKTGDADIPAGVLDDGLGHVAALLPDRGDTAHDDIVHSGRIQVVTGLQLVEQARPEHDGFDFVEGTARLALASGRANGIVDVRRISHV